MSRRFGHLPASVSGLLLVPALAVGQTSESGRRIPDAAVTVATAARAAPVAPKVDGKLDDAAWRAAPRFSGFVQQDPHEGQPGTEPTAFQVLYSDAALYIAVRATDSRAADIAARLTRRDEWSPSDEITIMIDSHRDRRTGYAFTVNAAGVKQDAYLYNDFDRDQRWDAVWDAQVSIDTAGWTAEFRIPFSQLRFSEAAAHTFGFNVSRRINRLNESQYWRLVPKQAAGFVSLFGDLNGLTGLQPPARLEVLPYTAATSRARPRVPGNPFRAGATRTAALGGDLKVGINSALTLTTTFNPDFGQVEADPAVVNLSAFETFFAERRPFFTEGLDLFRFRLADGDGDGSQEELFYTRRIGRTPQGAADPRGGYAESVDRSTILGAGKLSGKTQQGWSIGVLGAMTAEETAGVLDENGDLHRDVVEPRTAYGVARIAKELRGGLTQIGLFGTTVQRSLPDRLRWLHSEAYTGGANWSHRFGDNTYQLSGRIVGSLVRGSAEAIALTQQSSARYYQRPDADYLEFDPTRTSLSGYAAGVNAGRTAGNWRWNVGVDARSPGFEVNDIGFMRETDRLQQGVWINRRWLTPGSVFRRFNLNLNQWSVWTFGGERRTVGGNINANYTLRNYWSGWLGVNFNGSGISTTALRGGPALDVPGRINGWFGFQTDSRKPIHASIEAWGAGNTDDNSWNVGLYSNLTWRPAANLDLSLAPAVDYNRNDWQYLITADVAAAPEYLFGELRQTTARMTVRSNITFSPTLSLQVYAQPFVSSGRYLGFKRVDEPRAGRFPDQFDALNADRAVRDAHGNVALDVHGDGQADLTLPNPDFTVLSFHSNVVLRWEYQLGSTFFVVWQHGRNGSDGDGHLRLGDRLGELFRSQSENVLLVKLNYWLSL